MTSPPPSPPNAVKNNPWIRNSSAAAAAVSATSTTTLAGEWPPLKASQIPVAESQAQAEAEMPQPPATSAADPAAAAAAPDSSSAPPPPPSPVSTNHSRNHNPNHSNHRRGVRSQGRNHQQQGNFPHNRFPQWNPNPNPNVGFSRFPPPSVWSPPPPQWASYPGPPPLPFYQNGYTDGNAHHLVYNAMLPTAHTYFPMGPPPLPFPPGPAVSQLMIDIRKQIEYYFSEVNLNTDGFLKRHMDKEFGWVDLKLVAGFKMVARLTDDLETVKGALILSDVVQLQGDKIRRKNDWRRWILEEK